MRRRGFTQADMARYFRWDQSFVSVLLSGRRNPGLDTAVTIERLTGIPVEAWVSNEVDTTTSAVAANGSKSQRDK